MLAHTSELHRLGVDLYEQGDDDFDVSVVTGEMGDLAVRSVNGPTTFGIQVVVLGEVVMTATPAGLLEYRRPGEWEPLLTATRQMMDGLFGPESLEPGACH